MCGLWVHILIMKDHIFTINGSFTVVFVTLSTYASHISSGTGVCTLSSWGRMALSIIASHNSVGCTELHPRMGKICRTLESFHSQRWLVSHTQPHKNCLMNIIMQKLEKSYTVGVTRLQFCREAREKEQSLSVHTALCCSNLVVHTATCKQEYSFWSAMETAFLE